MSTPCAVPWALASCSGMAGLGLRSKCLKQSPSLFLLKNLLNQEMLGF